MNLVKFHKPGYSVNNNLVDELFNNFLKNDYHENYLQNCGNQPATNVFETDKDFRIELLLPGFPKEEVKMSYHKNLLTIKVDQKEEKGEGKKEEFKYAHREFGAFEFEKHFKVPNSVDAENIQAKFEDGILRVILPKKEEALEKAPLEIKIA